MGKDAKRSSKSKRAKKEHKSSKRRSSASSDSDTESSSSSSTDDSRSSSRSRSRSASRSHRKHSSSSSAKHHRSRSSRSRSRSRSEDRDRKKKGSKRKTSRSRSRSRERSSDRRKHAKHEPRSRSRSRSRSVKRESASASGSAAAPPPLSSSDLRRIKDEEKARLKASETPAERAARRAAKKALKAIHKSGGAAALPGMLPGSAASATAGFVDSQASKPFVWKKKYEVAIASGQAPQILSRDELAAKQRMLAKEIEEIKARKIARADERAQMDALRDQMSRDAEAETIEGWEEKEEEFHRSNAALRTEMRINSGREKCVDILAKNRALFRKLLAGPTDDERSDHPEWRGAALDPALAPAKDLELTEPHLMFLSGDLPWRDLEYLSRDIQSFLDLDVREDREYWTACAKLCGDALKKQKAAAFAPGAAHNYSNRGAGRGQQSGSAAAASSSADGGPTVRDDIALLLRGKSLSELEELEREIHLVVTGSPQASAALSAMADGLDHTYWEGVARELAHFKSVAYLREFHEALLQARLKDLQHFVREEEKAEREQRAKAYADRVEAAGGGAAGAAAVAAADAEADQLEDGLQADAEDDLDFEPVLIPHEEFDAGMEDATAAGAGREDSGSFSPTLEPAEEADDRARGVRAVDPEADARELAEARRAVAEQKQREMEARAQMEAGSAVAVTPASAAAAVAFGGTLPSAAAAAAAAGGSSAESDAAFRRESSRALGADEVRLSTSFAIPDQTYWWGDKFRPRKPRFFNRVKTGFEWNKYNGTHYDKENPPPKIVQGYKFNIFYPDLIDPSVPPRYRMEPDPEGNPDFVILRFMAGPPYEDVAFKIVRKEWEYSFKRGYKCVFDRGVLCLYFNFRRYFYRR